MEIPIPIPKTPDIFSFGFDKTMTRTLTSGAGTTVRDPNSERLTPESKTIFDPDGGHNHDGANSRVVSGWFILPTCTYASADSPTFTFTISGDATSYLSVGMRIRLTQTTVKYFLVTKVAYSSPNTTVTMYGGTDYTLTNALITNPGYSFHKAPYGFPLDPTKWTVRQADGTSRAQATPGNGTWYNLGTTNSQLSIPIGAWKVSYRVRVYVDNAAGGAVAAYMFAALSTVNNDASDGDLTSGSYLAENSDLNEQMQTFYCEKYLTLSSKTLYYLNAMTTWTTGTMGNIAFSVTDGVPVNKIIQAVSAYL